MGEFHKRKKGAEFVMPYSAQTNLAILRINIRSVGIKRLFRKWALNSENAELLTAIFLLRTAKAVPTIGVKGILKKPIFRKCVDSALGKGDVIFLKTIARELEQEETTKIASKLEWFLIRYWDNSFARLGPKAPPLDKLNRKSWRLIVRTSYTKTALKTIFAPFSRLLKICVFPSIAEFQLATAATSA